MGRCAIVFGNFVYSIATAANRIIFNLHNDFILLFGSTAKVSIWRVAMAGLREKPLHIGGESDAVTYLPFSQGQAWRHENSWDHNRYSYAKPINHIPSRERYCGGTLPIALGKSFLFEYENSSIYWSSYVDDSIEFIHKFHNFLWKYQSFKPSSIILSALFTVLHHSHVPFCFLHFTSLLSISPSQKIHFFASIISSIHLSTTPLFRTPRSIYDFCMWNTFYFMIYEKFQWTGVGLNTLCA